MRIDWEIFRRNITENKIKCVLTLELIEEGEKKSGDIK